jgi:hypothetical protein
MGGVLDPPASVEAVPGFLLQALKDPDGANLDRIQVIKGWRDGDGQLRETIYDVAASDGRIVNAEGDLPPVGNTVDVANASFTNDIGAVQLTTWWQDPDFDPQEEAFYYARILEIPTPRWTAYDAKYFGINLPDEVPLVTQERAYTSPIWYSPRQGE